MTDEPSRRHVTKPTAAQMLAFRMKGILPPGVSLAEAGVLNAAAREAGAARLDVMHPYERLIRGGGAR